MGGARHFSCNQSPSACVALVNLEDIKNMHTMTKRFVLPLAATTAALIAPATAWAEPLNRSQISSDAKWVLHLDVDALRKTKLGARALQLANTKYRAALSDAGLNFNTDFDKLANITAYGTEFKQGDPEGVLILKSRSDLKTDLDALMGLSALSGDESKKILKTTEGDVQNYSVGNDMHGSLVSSDTLVLGKTKTLLSTGKEALAGKGSNLSTAQTFKEFAPTGDGYFFMVLAQGFGSSASVPPQAQILREAEGGAIVIGEKEDKLFMNLTLKGKNAEVITQMQQVVQGLMALASLSEEAPPELKELIRGANVSTKEQILNVSLSFPSSKAIEKMEQLAK